MTNRPPTCTSCQHCKETFFTPRCTRHAKWYASYKPVTGEMDRWIGGIVPCSQERGLYGKCGYAGRFHAPRKSTWQAINEWFARHREKPS